LPNLFHAMKLTKTHLAVGIILLVLMADQLLKVYVKTHMMIGDEIHLIGNRILIHFTENNGMAFGIQLGGEFGKLALSLFRIAAVVVIGFYLSKLVRQNAPTGVIVGVSLILAGAAGNIFDSLFYGMIFDDSYGKIATLFPPGGGYAPFLHGRVVDMLYMPVIQTVWPKWVPFVGGTELIFFRPVFNLADSAITTGVLYILIFQRKFFAQPVQPVPAKSSEEPVQ